jgi:hypothetical protein
MTFASTPDATNLKNERVRMKFWMSIIVCATLATAAGCVPEPEPTTFVMENAGDEEIYGGGGWLSVEADGNPVWLSRPQCFQECGQPPSGCPDVISYPSVTRIAPGESFESTWDGVYYEQPDGKNCYKERRRKAEFTAQFCFGHDYEEHEEYEGDRDAGPENVIYGAYVEDAECESVSFERGEFVEFLANE